LGFSVLTLIDLPKLNQKQILAELAVYSVLMAAALVLTVLYILDVPFRTRSEIPSILLRTFSGCSI
jgi:hypothetical protein